MSPNEDDDNPWAKKKPKDSEEQKEKIKKAPPKRKLESEGIDDFISNIKEKLDKKNEDIKKKGLFNAGSDEMKKMFSSGDGGNTPNMPPISKNMISLTLVSFIGLWLASGFYIVNEGNTSVVLRFGKLSRVIVNSGPAYHLPWPIESKIVRRTDNTNQYDSAIKSDKGDDEKTLVLTGDENMIHVNYFITWKIKDLPNFLFTNTTPEETIKVAADSAIREVLGQRTAQLALTTERESTGQQAREVLQKILDHYQIGVEIANFQLQMVEPPSQVIDAFNDMQASLIDADRLQNDAQAYANSIIPNARGQAVSIVQEAKSYHETTIGKAKGEAAQFESIYKAYKDHKEIFLQRFYLESMQRILGSIKNKTVLSDSLSHGVLPHVSLNQKNEKPKTEKGK